MGARARIKPGPPEKTPQKTPEQKWEDFLTIAENDKGIKRSIDFLFSKFIMKIGPKHLKTSPPQQQLNIKGPVRTKFFPKLGLNSSVKKLFNVAGKIYAKMYPDEFKALVVRSKNNPKLLAALLGPKILREVLSYAKTTYKADGRARDYDLTADLEKRLSVIMKQL